nr:retrotransposon protein, putative, Ty1-copia subclass [Tanacetum cinerariifolium]
TMADMTAPTGQVPTMAPLVAVYSSLQSPKSKRTIKSRAKRSSKIISLGHDSTLLASSHTMKMKMEILLEPTSNKLLVGDKLAKSLDLLLLYVIHKLTGFSEKQKLIGPNFIDWYRQLRIVLSIEDELNYLEHHIPPVPVAYADPKSEKWLNAMNVEMQSMKDNEVWVLVELPPNGKTIGSKWLFNKKTDMDGNVHIYKARLVAKGYTQTLGIDYEETFSPVTDIKAIRILIVIAAYYDYEIWKMDVKMASLNGYLNEEVYMEQPEGFINPKYPNRVCKLKRSIYGLKQASRQ